MITLLPTPVLCYSQVSSPNLALLRSSMFFAPLSSLVFYNSTFSALTHSLRPVHQLPQVRTTATETATLVEAQKNRHFQACSAWKLICDPASQGGWLPTESWVLLRRFCLFKRKFSSSLWRMLGLSPLMPPLNGVKPAS